MKNVNNKKLRNLISSVILMSICTIASCLMLIEMQHDMSITLFWIAFFGALLLGCLMIALSFFDFEKIVKLGIVGIVVSFFIIGVFYIIYKAGYLALLDDVEALRVEISKTGSIVPVFIFVQFAQVCLVPIPATVTTILGLLLFSPADAILYSLIGMISGGIVMFFFGKFAGRKAVDWAIGKEDVQKYLDMTKGKDNALLTAMFLLPVFPDDILCAVAGIVGMKAWYFIAILVISKVSATVISVLFFTGNFIPLEGWWLLLWGIMIAVLLAVTILFFKNADKIEYKIVSLTEKFKRK